MVYEWVRGSRLDGDAQQIGDRIESIRARRGGAITPEAIVDEARDAASPMHPLFEWDDTEAARKYRLDQARLILRSITVSVRDDRRLPVRAFVAIERGAEEGRVYVGIRDAMRDDEARRQLLATAVREVQSWRQRYSRLQELARIFEMVDQLELPNPDEAP